MVSILTLSPHWSICENILWFTHIFSIFFSFKRLFMTKKGVISSQNSPQTLGNPHFGTTIHHRCFAYCLNQTNTLQATSLQPEILFCMLSGSYRLKWPPRDFQNNFWPKKFCRPKSNFVLYDPKTLPQTYLRCNVVALDIIPVAEMWPDPSTYKKLAKNDVFSWNPSVKRHVSEENCMNESRTTFYTKPTHFKLRNSSQEYFFACFRVRIE